MCNVCIVLAQVLPCTNIIQTRGTCAQARETELLESGTQLSVQLPASPEGFPRRDQVGRYKNRENI